jgi:hypothetical protein
MAEEDVCEIVWLYTLNHCKCIDDSCVGMFGWLVDSVATIELILIDDLKLMPTIYITMFMTWKSL